MWLIDSPRRGAGGRVIDARTSLNSRPTPQPRRGVDRGLLLCEVALCFALRSGFAEQGPAFAAEAASTLRSSCYGGRVGGVGSLRSTSRHVGKIPQAVLAGILTPEPVISLHEVEKKPDGLVTAGGLGYSGWFRGRLQNPIEETSSCTR